VHAHDFIPAGPRERRLAVADGFRALAAIAIVTGHLLVYSALGVEGHETLTALLTSFGICGVDCFFVLSGFLLARPYVEALIEPGRPLPSVREFATRRFFRIYPLYAVAVVFSAIGAMLHRHQPIPFAFLITHLTFLHGFSVQYINAIEDAPLWTMAVDVQFYVALPLVAALLAVALRGRDRATRIAAIAATLVAVCALSLVTRYIAYSHIPVTLQSFAGAAVYARNALGMGSAFALGTALALLRLTTRPPRPALARASIAIGILIGLALAPTGLDTSPYVGVQVIYDFAAAVAVAFALYGCAGIGSEGAKTRSAGARTRRRIGAGSLVGFIALISYPFYLFHWPVLMAIVGAVGAHLHGLAGTASYAFTICATTIVATIVVALVANIAVERVVGTLRAPRVLPDLGGAEIVPEHA
jgi:peptidoglycan/LPS O-acetylase OafA/YrhL